MNLGKAERGCVRAHPRAETYQLCADCVHALGEQPKSGPSSPCPRCAQPTPAARAAVLTALLADGCPHGCIDTCGFTVRVTRMLAAVTKESEAARE